MEPRLCRFAGMDDWSRDTGNGQVQQQNARCEPSRHGILLNVYGLGMSAGPIDSSVRLCVTRPPIGAELWELDVNRVKVGKSTEDLLDSCRLVYWHSNVMTTVAFVSST